MRPLKKEESEVKRATFEIEIDAVLINQVALMEKHTKISKTELVETALRRFVSQHKDYLPEEKH